MDRNEHFVSWCISKVKSTEKIRPMHPYTRALMEAIPQPDPFAPPPWLRFSAHGELPSPLNPPSGCRFRTRCNFAWEKCFNEEPELIEIKPKHKVACHLVTT